MRYEEKCGCNATIMIQTEGFNTYELAQVIEKWRTEHIHSPVGGEQNGNNEESTEN